MRLDPDTKEDSIQLFFYGLIILAVALAVVYITTGGFGYGLP